GLARGGVVRRLAEACAGAAPGGASPHGARCLPAPEATSSSRGPTDRAPGCASDRRRRRRREMNAPPTASPAPPSSPSIGSARLASGLASARTRALAAAERAVGRRLLASLPNAPVA